ncbi:guanylate kinase [Lachnospiraceae bacterium KHCPX20]|nr:guanylate kinase [Lachnospiraceae bacterium KHCPX20]
MLLVLCGKTAAGKDTVAAELVKKGFSRCVTDTTRKARPGEKDGIDYNFLTESDFLAKVERKEYLESRSYKNADGKTLWYGSRKEMYRRAKDENCLIILTPDAIPTLEKFSKEENISLSVVMITAPLATRYKRAVTRGDDKAEVLRRIHSDERDFAKFIAKGFRPDIVVENKNSALSAEFIHNFII